MDDYDLDSFLAAADQYYGNNGSAMQPDGSFDLGQLGLGNTYLDSGSYLGDILGGGYLGANTMPVYSPGDLTGELLSNTFYQPMESGMGSGGFELGPTSRGLTGFGIENLMNLDAGQMRLGLDDALAKGQISPVQYQAGVRNIDKVEEAKAEDDALAQQGLKLSQFVGGYPQSFDPNYLNRSVVGALPVGSFPFDERAHPAQSFIGPDGQPIESSYDYGTSRNGDTFIWNPQTKDIAGYLDDQLNPQYYQDIRIANNVADGRPTLWDGNGPVSKTNWSGGGGGGGSGGLSKSSQQSLQKGTSTAQGALELAKMAALLAQAVGQKAGIGKDKFGRGDNVENMGPSYSAMQSKRASSGKKYASGGAVKGGLLPISVKIAEHLGAGKVRGEGGGQDDLVPAKLSDGEYVMDAETVSALGDGSTEAGSKKLDEMRQNIRKHKRTGALSQIAPKAKAPERYMKGGK